MGLEILVLGTLVSHTITVSARMRRTTPLPSARAVLSGLDAFASLGIGA